MITATLKIAPIEFPTLARFVSSGKVVLFRSPTVGMVVKADADHAIGDMPDWAPLDESPADAWEILPPGSTVELKQE